ncbi:HlyD family efflux transporter periplasmic adaptor subunit [Microbulbifer hydrolyticus]|uniref:Adhesin transport system membrane fusion protein n=1 Tax=Microbulbifer hydrolyticus TaxID=48074 RepID=A0A6P1T9T3_9GAMM|nr:HlyD family efflux transporter periplasmic adaptor subunit [Microbulbifer hydrolyticus]MBB5210803.1 adhesin transport system membrane fusion protein [Microbulbifer hydrolyticus]QHQ38757.1 HlyD family efflux transporter periplasmic adaptor subunit [Microbulbifer hydrolyticus]
MEREVSTTDTQESAISRRPDQSSQAANVAILEADFHNAGAHYSEDSDDAELSRSGRVVWIFFLLLVSLVTWSYFAKVDEVSKGAGKVIPTSRAQIVQSLEGGILAQLNVTEGDIVTPGQVLAQLDPTKVRSNVQESEARYRAALASAARLSAEVNGTPLRFPEELTKYEDLIAKERRLFQTRQKSLRDSLISLEESRDLIESELSITRDLVKSGAASNVEVLRLSRQKSELDLKIKDVRSEYMVRAREELAGVSAEVSALTSVIEGRADSLTRLTLKSPVRGIVKDIEVTTIGGVIPPNGRLMEIVPLDDRLLIEAKISPRDIAFIHPGQEAKVKITAYDYSVYGGLDGKVTTISPDTIQDETRPGEYFYHVLILTESHALINRAGKEFPIVPGMVASVDVKTGSKTVFDYLVKPFNQAGEALRER